MPAAAAAAAAGVAGLAALARRWWLQAVHRWRDRLGVGAATRAAADLTALLCEVAVLEWVLSGARRFAADAARTMAGALRTAAETLQAETTGGAAAVDSGAGAASPGESDDVYAVVRADVVAAVRTMLGPSWQRLGAGRPRLDEVALGLGDRVRGVLREYREHLELRGIHEAPAFVNTSATREALNQAPAYLADIRRAWSDDLMVQLCSVEDIAFLYPSPEQTQVVRFAPRAAQAALAGSRDGRRDGLDTRTANIQVAALSRLAGALRLVPLRPTAVRTEVPVSGDPPGQI
jgi:hypothetical protein